MRAGQLLGPGTAAQPDGAQSRAVSAADVARRVVADHDRPRVLVGVELVQSQLEQRPIRLAYADLAGDDDRAEGAAQLRYFEFGPLRIGSSVGHNTQRPSVGQQLLQGCADVRPVWDQLGGPLPVGGVQSGDGGLGAEGFLDLFEELVPRTGVTLFRLKDPLQGEARALGELFG